MSGITASRGLGSTGSGPVPADTGRVAEDPHALDATMHAMQTAVNLDRVMCEIQARIRRARESLPGSALDCFSYPRDLAKVNDVVAGVELQHSRNRFVSVNCDYLLALRSTHEDGNVSSAMLSSRPGPRSRPAYSGRMRRVPQDGNWLGSLANVLRVRSRRLLRPIPGKTRHQAFPSDSSSDNAQLSTRRGLGLVLC